MNTAINAAGMVSLPAAIVAHLIDMSRTHVDDVESGIEDGTYDAAENVDLPSKQKSVEEAERLYRLALMPDKTPAMAVEDRPDPVIAVRPVELDGQWGEWNISQNLTDRWGEINYHDSENKPYGTLLDEGSELLERLRRQMVEESTFIVRKDGQYGLLFEIEFCSRESEYQMKMDDPEVWADYLAHDDLVRVLIEGMKPLIERFPGVQFAAPHEGQIVNDRAAAWAFIKDGQLDEAQRNQLYKALLSL